MAHASLDNAECGANLAVRHSNAADDLPSDAGFDPQRFLQALGAEQESAHMWAIQNNQALVNQRKETASSCHITRLR